MEQLDCEIRFQEDDTRESPGRLVGTLLTYEVRANDRPELFKAGALYFPPDGAIVINEMHDRKSPLLKATPTLVGAELRIDEPFLNTQRGRDTALLVQKRVLTGLSIEMYVEKAGRSRDGTREIRLAYCPRAAIVDVPAYKDSVVEVRERRIWHLDRELLRWL